MLSNWASAQDFVEKGREQHANDKRNRMKSFSSSSCTANGLSEFHTPGACSLHRVALSAHMANEGGNPLVSRCALRLAFDPHAIGFQPLHDP
jgi:hypothetical protein